jgi:hypothetical protein
MTTPPAFGWVKSSRSVNTSACVEVARTDTATLVRDTKHRAGGHLTATGAVWAGFLTTVKDGQLGQ